MYVRDFQDVGTLARVIQLSVAPVFLLTGIGTMLSVMTNRLGRVIDRARVLEARLENDGYRHKERADQALPALREFVSAVG